ncbi:hypothetical protein KVH27_19340 [Streptomyces olivaceus]|uniref:hypothetical protein n=1 Tax=Streptomyces olivaceus TaxID=47716 RepID=UPI001CC90F1B|nr:hypothetical protein [Streptomyces olivaceus]MBZ6250522.1 hypothetical protein [Streptomyces olivaceus]
MSSIDSQPAEPAEFAAFFVQHSRGEAHETVSEEFHQLLAAVNEHGKKGSLTITVTVEPPKGGMDGSPVAIAIDSALKAPKASAPPSIYFVDGHGNATRNDPRQTQAFDVRDLPTTKTEIKDI